VEKPADDNPSLMMCGPCMDYGACSRDGRYVGSSLLYESGANPSRPDHCDGSFEAYCDPSRNYRNITAILDSFDATDLLSTMSKYWKDYQGEFTLEVSIVTP
jgi:hypothetical protein